jgi:hypothetical protein
MKKNTTLYFREYLTWCSVNKLFLVIFQATVVLAYMYA